MNLPMFFKNENFPWKLHEVHRASSALSQRKTAKDPSTTACHFPSLEAQRKPF